MRNPFSKEQLRSQANALFGSHKVDTFYATEDGQFFTPEHKGDAESHARYLKCEVHEIKRDSPKPEKKAESKADTPKPEAKPEEQGKTDQPNQQGEKGAPGAGAESDSPAPETVKKRAGRKPKAQ